MLILQLQQIVTTGKEQGISADMIKIQLKEFLILQALNFIYNSAKWNSLIFTGGTAMRILGKTGRMSEDLDLDYLSGNFATTVFAKELLNYFKQLGVDDLKYTITGQDKIITVKFPILAELRLSSNKSESVFLYLKIELEKNNYKNFDVITTPIIKDNLFFVVKHYDFPTLFANKIGAILGRRGKIFHNKYDFRGRDFYDLIWFLEKGYLPNLDRITEILRVEQKIKIKTYQDVWDLLATRIKSINTIGIYDDLKNLIQGQESIKLLAKNYLTIFEKLVDEVSGGK